MIRRCDVFLQQTKRNLQLFSLRSSYSSIGERKNVEVRDWDGDAPDNIITNKVDTRGDIKINDRGERERGNTTRHTQRPRARRVYSNEPCRYLSSEGDLSRYLVRSCCSIFLPRCLLIFSAVPLLVLLVLARLLTLPCLHRKKNEVWFYWWRKSKFIYKWSVPRHLRALKTLVTDSLTKLERVPIFY